MEANPGLTEYKTSGLTLDDFKQAKLYMDAYGGKLNTMTDTVPAKPKTIKPKKMIKKLSGWKEVPAEDSPINDKPTGHPVSTEGFEKVVKELLAGYTYLYDKGLSTSMIVVLCAHYGGTTVAEAQAVFNGLKELAVKLKYKNEGADLPEID